MKFYRTVEYIISEFRLMEIGSKFDTEIVRGTLDDVIAARDAWAHGNARPDTDPCWDALYVQAHCPNGHPDFPGSWGCWVRYDIARG